MDGRLKGGAAWKTRRSWTSIGSGIERAIAETDKKYGAYCQHIAFAVCSDRLDAEECVNDTWLRAWNAMPDKRPSVLSTFLGRITRNLAINRFQRKTRKKRGGGEMELALEELEDCIPAALDVERRYELQEFRQAIGRFVSGLSETEQKVFVARYWYLALSRRSPGGCRSAPARPRACCFTCGIGCGCT